MMNKSFDCWDETKKTPISCSVQLSEFIFFGELFLSIDWSAGLCKYEPINPLESFPSKNQFHRAIILCPDFRQRGRQERPVSNGSSDLCTLMLGRFLCGTEKCLDCVLPSLPLPPSESGGWRINRKPPEADANGMLMPMVRPCVCAELEIGVCGGGFVFCSFEFFIFSWFCVATWEPQSCSSNFPAARSLAGRDCRLPTDERASILFARFRLQNQGKLKSCRIFFVCLLERIFIFQLLLRSYIDVCARGEIKKRQQKYLTYAPHLGNILSITRFDRFFHLKGEKTHNSPSSVLHVKVKHTNVSALNCATTNLWAS